MDDLYPNETTFFTPEEPQEQRTERNAEKAKAQEGMALLEELIKRFEERIGFYERIDSIPSEVESKPEEHLRAVLANRIVKENLVAEKDYLVSLRSQYGK